MHSPENKTAEAVLTTCYSVPRSRSSSNEEISILHDYDLADPAEWAPRIAVLMDAIPLATEADATVLSDELTELLIISGAVPPQIEDALAQILGCGDKPCG